MIINPTDGSVEIRGPITKEEKDLLHFFIDRKNAFEEEGADFEHDLKDKIQRHLGEMFEQQLKRSKQEVAFFDRDIKEMRGEQYNYIDLVRGHKEFQKELAERRIAASRSKSAQSQSANGTSKTPPPST
ncbi:hypothetical protein [Hyphococcus sp.]|uniref:hypothetical protein n=1 Tax=Hyphococcus sp. TaxID=2038636 RepID=UPI002085CD9D|nr:MAG: hypothetical protein DHS20C04_18080 [Marinicaulis sp.]